MFTDKKKEEVNSCVINHMIINLTNSESHFADEISIAAIPLFTLKDAERQEKVSN